MCSSTHRRMILHGAFCFAPRWGGVRGGGGGISWTRTTNNRTRQHSVLSLILVAILIHPCALLPRKANNCRELLTGSKGLSKGSQTRPRHVSRRDALATVVAVLIIALNDYPTKGGR